MTLPPEKLGYKGQKYAIRCRDRGGKVIKIGWSNNPKAFADAVEVHPSWHDHYAVDLTGPGRSGKGSIA